MFRRDRRAINPAHREADLILPTATLDEFHKFAAAITHRGALYRVDLAAVKP